MRRQLRNKDRHRPICDRVDIKRQRRPKQDGNILTQQPPRVPHLRYDRLPHLRDRFNLAKLGSKLRRSICSLARPPTSVQRRNHQHPPGLPRRRIDLRRPHEVHRRPDRVVPPRIMLSGLGGLRLNGLRRVRPAHKIQPVAIKVRVVPEPKQRSQSTQHRAGNKERHQPFPQYALRPHQLPEPGKPIPPPQSPSRHTG